MPTCRRTGVSTYQDSLRFCPFLSTWPVRAFTMHFVEGSSQINSNTKDKKLPEPLNAKALFVGRRQNIKSRPLSGGRKIRWIAFLGGGTCGQGERLSILIIRTSHLFNFCFIIFNCPHQMIWSFLPLRWSILYLMRKWHRVLQPCFKKFIETRTFQMQGLALSRI